VNSRSGKCFPPVSIYGIVELIERMLGVIREHALGHRPHAVRVTRVGVLDLVKVQRAVFPWLRDRVVHTEQYYSSAEPAQVLWQRFFSIRSVTLRICPCLNCHTVAEKETARISLDRAALERFR
jgi:hypothetical protein